MLYGQLDTYGTILGGLRQGKIWCKVDLNEHKFVIAKTRKVHELFLTTPLPSAAEKSEVVWMR